MTVFRARYILALLTRNASTRDTANDGTSLVDSFLPGKIFDLVDL